MYTYQHQCTVPCVPIGNQCTEPRVTIGNQCTIPGNQCTVPCVPIGNQCTVPGNQCTEPRVPICNLSSAYLSLPETSLFQTTPGNLPGRACNVSTPSTTRCRHMVSKFTKVTFDTMRLGVVGVLMPPVPGRGSCVHRGVRHYKGILWKVRREEVRVTLTHPQTSTLTHPQTSTLPLLSSTPMIIPPPQTSIP